MQKLILNSFTKEMDKEALKETIEKVFRPSTSRVVSSKLENLGYDPIRKVISMTFLF